MDLSCLKEKREREDNLIVQNSAAAAFTCIFNSVDYFWPVTLLHNSFNLLAIRLMYIDRVRLKNQPINHKVCLKEN